MQLLSLALSSLDAIISLGTIARERDFVRPEIVDEPVIQIQGGRHLLQELTVEVRTVYTLLLLYLVSSYS